MTRRGFALWGRTAVGTALALATLLVVRPLRPSADAPVAVALAVGVASAVTLFVLVARARPTVTARPVRAGVVVAKHGVIGLWAANEELVWRRLVLGEALRTGPVAAVLVSSVGFALVHRARKATQLTTGAVFGVAYVTTGTLVAPIVAHWLYNSLLAASPDRPLPAEAEAPT